MRKSISLSITVTDDTDTQWGGLGRLFTAFHFSFCLDWMVGCLL